MQLDTIPVQDQVGTRPGRFKTSSYLENTNKKSYTAGVIWYCGKTAEWMQLDTMSVQDQAGTRPVPVQDQ